MLIGASRHSVVWYVNGECFFDQAQNADAHRPVSHFVFLIVLGSLVATLYDRCGWGWDFAFMPYDDSWKLARKMFSQHFRQSASVRYRDEETRCARELLRDIARDPSDFFNHARL